ncbi:MAG: A/G-specific adenine glycosylase [Rothia sp. (in: high G+C Gram-positive bacteria)]|nr:A/G-specific adenine glycosylase [Rothia sp. (in: high G+C Gram-positive bacteria)]
MSSLQARGAISPQHLDLLHYRINSWYLENARSLPWRTGHNTPWEVMVSEFMLQQTPVKRVLPVWQQWLERWPTPADLAAVEPGEAVRAWGRLGYPRRAQRLHAAARAIVERHSGHVPSTYDELLALPGVGSYTAAAISVFAFGQRATVIDTNIRRVHARLISGKALPAKALTATETRLAEQLMPADLAESNLWNVSVMELGALTCTAKSPSCTTCPVLDYCAWVAAGKPEADYQPKGQAWAGTDRQLRGAMLAVLRASTDGVHPALLTTGGAPDITYPDQLRPAVLALAALNSPKEQLERCYTGLLADGLAQEKDGLVSL